jgi:hypothetical protein
VALVVAGSTLVGGEWAGGLEPQELCGAATRTPETATGYHVRASRWPPGTTCVYEIGPPASSRIAETVEVVVPASALDWAFLAAISLSAALLFVALSLVARSLLRGVRGRTTSP